MFLVGLALLASLHSCSAGSCRSRMIPSNACTLGGSLAAASVPAGLPVDSAHCNLIYDKADFQLQPGVKFPSAKAGHTYTLLMLDPDAPNLRTSQYYLHWIRANIEGCDLRTGNLDGSTEIASYLGPAPPEGTGLHRYELYVYVHQRPSQRVVEPVGDAERQHFDLEAWLASIARQGVHLCGPLSGVQFRSGYNPPPPNTQDI